MYLADLTDDAGFQRALARQRERESLALAEGERHFRAQVQKEAQRGESSRSVARKLLQHGIEPLAVALTAWLEEDKRTRGPKVLRRWIEQVGVEVAAYMTLKVALDGITRRREYTSVCCDISDLIVDELRYRRLQEKAPGLFQYKLKNFRTSSYAHMARSMDHAVRTAVDYEGQNIDTSDLTMPPRHRINLGAKLVELLTAILFNGAPLLAVVKHKKVVHGRQKTTLYLESTPETDAWLTERMDNLARSFRQAQNIPMVVPPLQWALGKRGGFRFALRGKYGIVRGARDKEFHKRLEQSEMPLVYGSLNALQNTPWRINRAVYELVRHIEQRGGGYAGIPMLQPDANPARPLDIDTNEAARKAWSKRAGRVKDGNHIRKMQAREIRRVLDTAAEVIEEDAIFFPHSLDFRGRVYPIADYLQPQGNDLAKALLMFSQGKPIEADGARWLAIHGANCLGETPEGKVSKMTLDERVEWIHAHTRDIVCVAGDPFSDNWWSTADDPLQFFAFCVEWRSLIEANARGETYVCALPVSMDGSCNGLQHFAALLRDENLGRTVNVAPQTRPQDIYQQVADIVTGRLEAMALQSPLAARLLGLGIVTRKLAKRPVMTFGYGSKWFGFKNQIGEYLRGLENWQHIKAVLSFQGADYRQHSQLGEATTMLSMFISDAVGLVPKSYKVHINEACGITATLIVETLNSKIAGTAGAAMEWMKKCARGIVKTGRAVEWVVPITGFRVKQEYIKWKRQQIKTVLAGNCVWPRLNIPTTDLDPIRQANGISPNVVHSLDAAALMLTVTQAAAEGVEAFAMIHDSYGATPADCSILARCCRQSFVRLYTTHDVVASLYQQFASQHEDPTKCPEPPLKGSLDVNGVLTSDYFFA